MIFLNTRKIIITLAIVGVIVGIFYLYKFFKNDESASIHESNNITTEKTKNNTEAISGDSNNVVAKKIEKENQIFVGQKLGAFIVKNFIVDGEELEGFDVEFDGETEVEGEYYLISYIEDSDCVDNFDDTQPYGYFGAAPNIDKECKMDTLVFSTQPFLSFNTKYNTYSVPLEEGNFIYINNQDAAKKMLLGKSGLAKIKIKNYRSTAYYYYGGFSNYADVVGVASSTVLLGIDKE